MEQKSENEKKKRFLLLLPLMVIPFLTFTVMSMGMVTGTNKNAENVKKPSGLNVQLPGFKDDHELKDKLSAYELAKADSLKRLSQIKQDPYFSQGPTQPAGNGASFFNNQMPSTSLQGSGPNLGHPDPNESKIYEKLNALNAAISQPANQDLNRTSGNQLTKGLASADVDRLEKMMMAMQNGSNTTPDPEMGQINGMLEKILDIQHPERASEKLRNSSINKGQVFAVAKDQDKDVVGILSPRVKVKSAGNGFYSLEDSKEEENFNAIPAVIHETQNLTSGAIVKLRLLSDVVIAGVTIPKDNFAFGEAQISGERLNIKINTIRYKNSLFPVKLEVCDMDGLNGLYIPGAISREVLKESGTSALTGIGLPTIDGGIAAQAATAGVELTKTFLSKKAKLIQVTVKSGYQVLLKDENNR